MSGDITASPASCPICSWSGTQGELGAHVSTHQTPPQPPQPNNG